MDSFEHLQFGALVKDLINSVFNSQLSLFSLILIYLSDIKDFLDQNILTLFDENSTFCLNIDM